MQRSGIGIRLYGKVDKNYDNMVNGFTKTDGLLALLSLIVCVAATFLAFWALSIDVRFPVTLVGAAISTAFVFLLMRLRKQGIKTVGISTCNWQKSLIIGAAIGIAVFAVRTFTGGVQGSRTLLNAFFHYFVVVSVFEEVVFRGYIQTRIYGIIKSDTLAVVIVGGLFALLHLIAPFMMILLEGFTHELSLYNMHSFLIWPFVFHIILNHLYRKYNTLIGPIVAHGFMNFTLFG